MALAIDTRMPTNTGFGVAGSPPTSPQTFAFNNVAGNLLYVWVGLGVSGASTAPTPTVTYNSVSMTSVLSCTTSGSTTGGKITLFRLAAPATGSNTVSIAFTTTGVLEVWAGATSMSGYVSGTPEVQSNTNHGTATSGAATLAGVAAGNICISCGGAGSTVTGGDQTIDWSKGVDELSSMGSGWAQTSTTTGSVTHTISGFPSDSFAIGLVEVTATGAGGGGTAPFRPVVSRLQAVNTAASW